MSGRISTKIVTKEHILLTLVGKVKHASALKRLAPAARLSTSVMK